MKSSWSHPLQQGLPAEGPAIEALSHRIINAALDAARWSPAEYAVVRRVVHACGDLSIADTLRFSPHAIEAGRLALSQGAPVFCDVRMVQAGLTRMPNSATTQIADPATIEYSREHGCTRAAAAVFLQAEKLHSSIYVVGNAPTAIWALLELFETRNITPALVVGIPVGFVGAAESKQALLESRLNCITNVGPRGGSPLAAAALNAIALLENP